MNTSSIIDLNADKPIFNVRWNSSQNLLYIGGIFNTIGGNSINKLASYDPSTSTYNDLSYPGADVYSLNFDSSNQLYVFDALAIIYRGISSTWAQIGQTDYIPDIYGGGFAFDNLNNVYFTQTFTSITYGSTTVNCNNIAKWDGTDWMSLDNGFVTSINLLIPTGSDMIFTNNGYLICSGTMNRSLTTPLNNLAVWNGTNWFSFGLGFSDSDKINTDYTSNMFYDNINNEIYIVGFFNNANGLAGYNGVAKLSLNNLNLVTGSFSVNSQSKNTINFTTQGDTLQIIGLNGGWNVASNIGITSI